MQLINPPPFIQLALPRAGRTAPGVQFMPAGSPPAHRGPRPLVSYASPEGAAWFEALLADMAPAEQGPLAPANQATRAPSQAGAETTAHAARRHRAGRQR